MNRPLLLLSFLLSLPTALASAQTSALWGHTGESWDPLGRLPDFSYAGYGAGERAIPSPPIVTDVTDFGAKGDGFTDDVQAFRNAIAYAASQGGGAIRIPQGTFVIGSILEIDRDGVVLRGSGSGPLGTTLYFPNHLRGLTGKTSPWINGEGGLIWVGDRDALTPGLGAQLTSVTKAQVRGDRELSVGSTAGIRPGDYILLRMTDPDDSLGRHLHNEQANPGNCSWQPLPLHWPVQVVGVNGNVLKLKQPLRIDVRLNWSPRVHRYTPVREVGIENLSMACAPHAYPGHLTELGYNPITFQGALDCWMQTVTLYDVDNGPSFCGATKNCTMRGVAIFGNMNPHHGFSFIEGTSDCMLEDFYIQPIFIHGVTLDHIPTGNVIRRGWGTDIYLDHHKDASYENLFSDLQVGYGPFVWSSGGSSCAGPQAGARNTYWNLRANNWSAPPPPNWVDIQANLIPAQTNVQTVNNAWCEAVANLTPPDLYASQLERRIEDEVLQGTLHSVATFEDGTTSPLGQEEGGAVRSAAGAVMIDDIALTRFVESRHRFDDQEVLFQVAAGLPRNARVGVALRAPSTSTKPGATTRVVLEGRGSGGNVAQYVVVRLEDQSGLLRQSQSLWLDPANRALTVRVVVEGRRVRAWVDDQLALDHTGIAQPAGGGYTSFWGDRDDAIRGGALGFLQAKVHAPGQGTEIHIDGNGTIWITLHQDGLFAGAFDPSSFHFFIDDQIQLGYAQFLALVWPKLLGGIQPLSLHHATFGIRLPLPEGTRLGVQYDGAYDETVVPWW